MTYLLVGNPTAQSGRARERIDHARRGLEARGAEVRVVTTAPAGGTVARVREAARQSGRLESLLLSEFPAEVSTVLSKTGRPEIATDPMGIEMSDVFVMLHPPDQWSYGSKQELIEAMQEVLEHRTPGVALGFSQPIELRVSELIAGVRSEIAIKIFGEDMDVLQSVANGTRR